MPRKTVDCRLRPPTLSGDSFESLYKLAEWADDLLKQESDIRKLLVERTPKGDEPQAFAHQYFLNLECIVECVAAIAQLKRLNTERNTVDWLESYTQMVQSVEAARHWCQLVLVWKEALQGGAVVTNLPGSRVDADELRRKYKESYERATRGDKQKLLLSWSAPLPIGPRQLRRILKK